MGSNLVIAAVPDENDRVWKVSSEKIPHLTLLFLGEADKVSNLDQIMLFVQHAANTSLNRFYLPVDRRGELGDDKADVLFFKKNRYDFKAISDFRSMLLKDDNIKTAYDSADQFDGPWKPHLTLGYPATPAKPVDDDHPFYDVQFNKIAVWTGNFEGPDFLLKDYWDDFEEMGIDMDAPALAMSGTKGMKWGVRNDENRTAIEKAAGSSKGKVGKAVAETARFGRDVQFESKIMDKKVREDGEPSGHDKVHSAITRKAEKPFQNSLKEIKAKPEHQKAAKFRNRLLHPFDSGTKAYRKEVRESYVKHLEEAANSMKNESGTRQYTIRDHHGNAPESKYYWEVNSREVKHATGAEAAIFLEVLMDEDGFITGTKEVDKPMIHTADIGAEFLEQFGVELRQSGVKGMKWGVRNEKSGAESGNSETKRVLLAGQFAFLSPKFREHVSSDTKTKVALFGANAIFSSTVRADLKQASKKVSLDKADSEWDKSLKNGSAWVAVNNSSADHFNKHIDAVNNKYPKDRDWSKEDYAHPKSPEFKKYMKDIDKLTQDSIKHAANELDLKNPSGTKEVEITSHGPGDYSLSVKRVKHATNNDTIQIKVNYQQDASGQVTGFTYSDDGDQPVDSMTQSAESDEALVHSLTDIGEEFVLAHYGKKGMKWGVRNAPVAVNATATSKVPHGSRRKTKIKTKGGENQDASSDAIKVAEAHAKLRKSGVKALSNKELQDVQTRLNLERNVKALVGAKTKVGQGRSFVKTTTGWGKDLNDTINTAANTDRLIRGNK